jgi:GYF domain 2
MRFRRWVILKAILLLLVWIWPVSMAVGFREDLIKAGHPSLAIALIGVGAVVNVGWIIFLSRYLKWPAMSRFLLPPPKVNLLSLYVYSHGQQCGPYPITQIKQLASAGQLQWTDLAWFQEKWVPLSSLPGI